MSELTPEQQQKLEEDNQIRLALKQNLEKHYMNLIGFMNTLSCNPQYKTFCFMNLDQGMFWARTGIDTMQFNFQSQAQEANPQQESQPHDAA